MNTITEPTLLRPPEVAVMLGVSRALAYRWIQDGTLPCLRIGHTVRVPVSALRDWINSSTRKAAVQPEAR